MDEPRSLLFLGQAVDKVTALGEVARADPALQREVRITFTGRDDDGRYHTYVSAQGPLWQAMLNCVIDCIMELDPYPDRYLDEEVETLGNAFGLTALIMEAVGESGADLRIRPLPRSRRTA
jgi:hypothetical protein